MDKRFNPYESDIQSKKRAIVFNFVEGYYEFDALRAMNEHLNEILVPEYADIVIVVPGLNGIYEI